MFGVSLSSCPADDYNTDSDWELPRTLAKEFVLQYKIQIIVERSEPVRDRRKFIEGTVVSPISLALYRQYNTVYDTSCLDTAVGSFCCLQVIFGDF